MRVPPPPSAARTSSSSGLQNPKAVLAFLAALVALAVLAAGAAAPRVVEGLDLEAAAAVPLAAVAGFAALSLAAGARRRHEVTLGRAGGGRLARAARALAVVALLVALTAALAFGVFVLLVVLEGR